MSTKISELRVGDIVAISTRRHELLGRAPYTLDWKITKITPTGQITVQQTKPGLTMLKRRFDKYAQEISAHTVLSTAFLEPNHLKAVREVHLWQLLDNVRKALDALRKELNTGAVPATYAEHANQSAVLGKHLETYNKAIWQAHLGGAFQ